MLMLLTSLPTVNQARSFISLNPHNTPMRKIQLLSVPLFYCSRYFWDLLQVIQPGETKPCLNSSLISEFEFLAAHLSFTSNACILIRNPDYFHIQEILI